MALEEPAASVDEGCDGRGARVPPGAAVRENLKSRHRNSLNLIYPSIL